MDNCHNYATTSKKKRIPISDDIHIIIKKFRDKDKHDEKPSNSGDHDYDDEHSMDSEELKRIRSAEPSSTCVGASTSSSNSSGTLGAIGTIMAGSVPIGASSSAVQQPAASQSDDIKLILKKLTNIEDLLKVVAEQSFNRLAALKQEAASTTTVVPTTAASLGLIAADPTCINVESTFKFPMRTLKELIELNKGICSDESLYNKLFEHLTKIKLECDENIVMNALSMIVSDEVLDAVSWDGGKKFKLSSLVIFSDSLYVAWFKDKLKYDEYVAEMKEAIEKSHRRYAKAKTKKFTQQHQTLTLTTASGATTTATVVSDGQLFLS
ncbi:uncharacterized protein LOC129777237 [Toxorhynchites rutilus septentrionalis]|uniref:uncharacterized protein LOC129777237 n=1 Tax=Toxorhynchites rutilus septentrionalis TaxID=329112 RepID=UPI00247921DF|nr:uncharacterized protein LOC129777237 [Toxorhynchites rutilus septentrionalis]